MLIDGGIGDSQPTADKIKKLAEVLGVSGDSLLDSTTDDIARKSLGKRELLDLFTEVEKLDFWYNTTGKNRYTKLWTFLTNGTPPIVFR